MQPLWTNPPMQQPGQPVQPQMPGSSLAGALMQRQPMPQAQNPMGQIPLASLMALMKPDQSYGNPNGTPSMGQGMPAETLAAQMGSNMQIGQPGAPISGMPQRQDWGWLGRMFGGGGGGIAG